MLITVQKQTTAWNFLLLKWKFNVINEQRPQSVFQCKLLSPISASGTQLDMQSRYAQHLAALGYILGSQHSSIRRRLVTVGLHFHSTSYTNYCLATSKQAKQNHPSIGTVENHGKKMAKKHGRLLWRSQKSWQKHGKDMASNHGPKQHYTVYKIQHPALSTIITCNTRFSSVKFCHCGALTNFRKSKIRLSTMSW